MHRVEALGVVRIGTGGGLLRSLFYPFYCSVCVSARIRVCVCPQLMYDALVYIGN